jgi:hypothetical protein
MAFQLPPGVSSLVLPGIGSISAGQILHGDLERYVTLGLLMEVPDSAPAPKAAPKAAAVLTEQLPASEELVDKSGEAAVDTSGEAEADTSPTDEPHPFKDLPPVRQPKAPNKRR